MTYSDELSAPIRTLHGLLSEVLEPETLIWLDECIGEVWSTPHPLGPLTLHHAEAARRLDILPLGPPAESVNTACGALCASHWTRTDAARACLVAASMGRGKTTDLELVLTLFREGSQGEQVSLMRVLCALPGGEALLPLAQEASRVNNLQIYGALALDNPYPAAWYDAQDFNRMILKCLFNGLALSRVIGLEKRANPSLSRLCADYREERVLAGRRVPADIWLALVPKAGPQGLELAVSALKTGDPEHRWNAAQALVARAGEARIRRMLEELRERESDPRIAELLATI